ncbi:MAG: HlyD family efflux transporter periplasmic adaptor subunit [Bacteroidota bacterium]
MSLLRGGGFIACNEDGGVKLITIHQYNFHTTNSRVTMKAEDLNKIEIRSEELDEILGHAPNWILRRGIGIIFLVIALVFVGCWFIRYPDVLTSTIVVTTNNAPAAISARSNGKIESLFVSDKQTVEAGKLLAVIENPAKLNDVLDLKNKLNSFHKCLYGFDSIECIKTEWRNDYVLGDLQQGFAGFMKSFQDYRTFVTLNYHQKKMQSLQKQRARYQTYYNRLTGQSDLAQNDLDLMRKQYNRDSMLHKQNVIAESDFEKSESQLLQKRFSSENSKTTLASTLIQMGQIEDQMLDMQLQYIDQKKQLQSSLIHSYELLQGQVQLWEKNFLLISPIAGKVSFNKFWSVNQNVLAGDIVVTIIPREQTSVIGRVKLPVQGSGKVKAGQHVNIKFAGFPYVDFGMVEGTVRSVSIMPQDNNYTVDISLPQGLKTNYNITLPFSQEMQGTAEIITEDKRLLERLFQPILFFLDKNVHN